MFFRGKFSSNKWENFDRYLGKLGKVFLSMKFIFQKGLLFGKNFCFALESILKKKISFSFVTQTDFIINPKDYLSGKEYNKHSLALNDGTLCGAFLTKRVLFQRMPYFMQRDYLSLKKASAGEIVTFFSKHHRAIGKCNSSGGKGMGVFSDSDSTLLEQLKLKKIDVLEEIIEQHEAYSAINASSVNTLRIHTIRTTQGCRVFLYPKLRVGSAGEIVDIGINGAISYRILLDHEGYILGGFKSGKETVLCRKHEDTGYCFTPGKKLPFVHEAEEMCIAAAAKMPEARYIGWDVAITEQGPVLVEANFISGAIDKYQLLHYLTYGCGNGKEIQAMLDYGLENIKHDENCELWAVWFVDLSYMYTPHATPNARQQFMLLLQSALRNYGITFVRIKNSKVNCSIMCDWDNKLVKFGKSEVKELPLPDEVPEDIFVADILARDLAQKIYSGLASCRK